MKNIFKKFIVIILAGAGALSSLYSCNTGKKVIEVTETISSWDTAYNPFEDTAVVRLLKEAEKKDSTNIANNKSLRSASYTKTITKNIYYGQAIGVHDTMEHLYFDAVQPNNTKLHALFVCLHGGGGFMGDKAGGMHPFYDGLVTSLGITAAYPNYRLADVNQFTGKTVDQSTILMWDEMYRSLQDAYAVVRYILAHNDIYHIDPNQIYIGGVSWGAVCGVMSVHWQPSEYGVLDTMKWRNISNGNTKFTIVGGICLSGAAFTLQDIDATNKPLILCYGGIDSTLKCNGGSNHRCPYIGTCQVLSEGAKYSNPVYPFYIATAGHCMKGSNPFETAENLLESKNFINSTLKTLIH